MKRIIPHVRLQLDVEGSAAIDTQVLKEVLEKILAQQFNPQLSTFRVVGSRREIKGEWTTELI